MCETPASSTQGVAVGRPRWAVLYAMTVPQVAAILAVEAGGMPSALRAGVQGALAISVFVTMAVWSHHNRSAMDLQEWCGCARDHVTVRVIDSWQPASPLPPLPGSVVVPQEREYEVAAR